MIRIVRDGWHPLLPLLQRSVSVEIDSDWVGVPLDVLVSGASRQVN